MINSKEVVKLSFINIFAASLFISGCDSSLEQIAELNRLDDEVLSLESQVNSLNAAKSNLEREIAGKEARLEQCAKDKAFTQANLEKLVK